MAVRSELDKLPTLHYRNPRTVWKSSLTLFCLHCQREIRTGDDVTFNTVYHGDEQVEIFVHVDCRSVDTRDRITTPDPVIVETPRGTRRLIMAPKAKAGKKGGGKSTPKKKQAVEDEEEETTEETESEDEESQVEGETESDEEDDEADESDDSEDEDDEEEDPKPKKGKGKASGKAASKDKGGAKKGKDKEAKKGGSKGGAKEKGAFAKNTGIEVLALLPETTPKKVRRVAEDLSKAKPVDNAALILLRDGIKVAAKELRANKKGSSASKLSALNSRVRRLEREARP